MKSLPQMDAEPEHPARSSRSLAGGALAVAAARIIGIVAGGAVSVIVARLLGPDGTGQFAVLVGLVVVLTGTMTLGLDVGFSWMVAGRRWPAAAAVRTATLAALVLGLAGATLGLGLYVVAADSAFGGIELGTAAMGLAALPPALTWLMLGAIAIASERYEAVTAMALAYALTYVATVAVLGAVAGLDGAVAGLLCAHVAATLAGLVWAHRAPLGELVAAAAEELRRLREAFRFGIKAYVGNALTALNYRFDIFLINAYAGAAEAGYYAIAFTAINGLLLLPRVLGNVLFPRLASLEAGTDAESRRALEDQAMRHTILIVLSTAAVTAAAIPLVVGPVFGESFEAAIEPALILIPGAIALGLGSTLFASLAGRGHPEYAMRIALVVTPAAIGLYFLLIPGFGMVGAAVASDIAYVAIAVLAAFSLRRLTGADPPRRLRPGRAELVDYRRLAALMGRRLRGEGTRP
jgi:O-antigen/teichoic acid export membrane protein